MSTVTEGVAASVTDGSGCGKWGERTPWTSCSQDGVPLADAPLWCSVPWCYVDVESCRQTSAAVTRSVMFTSSTLGLDLYYSYELCSIGAGSQLYSWTDS